MKKLLLLCVILLSGCAGVQQLAGEPFYLTESDEVVSERMFIRNASLSIDVYDLEESVQKVTKITENAKGYVKQKSKSGEKNASLYLRVPSDKLKSVVEEIAKMGKVTEKEVSSKDVTEKYVDINARLKNKIVLRDKLKKLLEKAKSVKDILAIERELNRVQSDIDSMQGRMNSLESKIEFAELDVYFNRKPILGPLGYVFKGFWWGVEKMFIIRR